MKISRILSLVVSLLLWSSQMSSQSSYLEKGQNGIGMSGNYSSNQGASGIGGSGGFSVDGIFDFGLSVARISFTSKLDGQNLSASVNSPFITFNVIKQDEANPISLAISAAYLNYKYSSPAFDQYDVTMDATGYSLGISIYGNISASSVIKIQPAAGVSYVSISAAAKDMYGSNVASTNTSTVFDLGLSLLFQTGSTVVFGIGPSLGTDKDNNYAFEMSAGFVFVL